MVSFIIGGLPRPEYNTFVLFSGEANTVDRICQKLLSYARSEPGIPGSLHPAARKDTAHAARDKVKKPKDKPASSGTSGASSAAQEDCRNFAAGRCRNGDNCRFRHTQPPTAPASSAQQPSVSPPARHCSHCNKDGHTQETCFGLHPELLEKFRQDRAARDQAHFGSNSRSAPVSAQPVGQNGPTDSFRMFSWADSYQHQDCRPRW